MRKQSMCFLFAASLLGCGGGKVATNPSDAGPPAGGDGGAMPDASVDGSVPPVATGPIRLLYSDLTSGPAQGGENGDGTIVSLFGRGFGAAQGTSTVTVGAAAVARYLSWSDTKIAIQIGAANTTGDIVVHTAQGDSTGLPFTVRAGNIFCVGPSGADTATGAFGACKKTWRKAIVLLHAGDILYFLDGLSQVADDGTGWNAAGALSAGWGSVTGTSAAPIALVAYPGALVTIGSTTGPTNGIRLVQDGAMLNNYVIAGFRLRGAVGALSISGGSGHRVVGNDISSPNAGSQSGCFSAAQTSNIAFLGNDAHDCGAVGSDKQDHTCYFTTDTNHVEAAFNRIHDSKACYGIQFHSSPLDASSGMNQFDLNVHDNVFYNLTCAAVNFATVDPGKGAVLFQHNTVYKVAAQVASDGGSDGCLFVPNYTNTGSAGGGQLDVSGNVFSTCGGGALVFNTGPVTVNDHGNDYFATTPAPTTNGDFSIDPSFANVTSADFDIQATDAKLNGLGARLFATP